jgi:hypothetical protein
MKKGGVKIDEDCKSRVLWKRYWVLEMLGFKKSFLRREEK